MMWERFAPLAVLAACSSKHTSTVNEVQSETSSTGGAAAVSAGSGTTGGVFGGAGEVGVAVGGEITVGGAGGAVASSSASGTGGAGGAGTETSIQTTGGTGDSGGTVGATTSSDPPEVYLAEPEAGTEYLCSGTGGCEVEMLACSNTQDPIWLHQCCSTEYTPELESECPSSHPYGVKLTRLVWDSQEEDGDWTDPTVLRVAFTTNSFEEAPGVDVWVDSDPVPVDFTDRATFCGATAESEYHIAPLTVSVGDGTPEVIELEIFRDGESVFLGEEPFAGMATVSFGDFVLERGYNELVARSVKPTGLVGESAECVVDNR